MKLRKALDKAKKAREEIERSSGKLKPPIGVISPEGSVAADEWKSPVYSNSVNVELNTKVLLDNRCVCIAPDAPQLDFYKILRTKIQQMTREKGWNTLMITSAQPREGKTLTTINLALTFARAFNQTVLLVDCDLRRQNVHKVMGFESDAGLIDYLVDDKPLKKSIIWPGIEKLTLISGGRPFENSTELLGSSRMKALVEEMKSRYDDRYVLFDVPPILTGADALALAPHVDSIVMVVREGYTSLRDVQKAVDLIPREKFLGFVINRQKISKTKGYEYYRGRL